MSKLSPGRAFVLSLIAAGVAGAAWFNGAAEANQQPVHQPPAPITQVDVPAFPTDQPAEIDGREAQADLPGVVTEVAPVPAAPPAAAPPTVAVAPSVVVPPPVAPTQAAAGFREDPESAHPGFREDPESYDPGFRQDEESYEGTDSIPDCGYADPTVPGGYVPLACQVETQP